MDNLRRFLEPLLRNKVSVFIASLIFSQWHIFTMASIFTVKKTIDFIVAQDYHNFVILLLLYI